MNGLSGRKLREYRKRKGLTISQLALLSGYSKGGISMLENGKRDSITTKTLKRLAKALGADYKDLI